MIPQSKQLFRRPHPSGVFVETHITHLAVADAGKLAELLPRYIPAQAGDKQAIDPVNMLTCDADTTRLNIPTNRLAGPSWLLHRFSSHRGEL